MQRQQRFAHSRIESLCQMLERHLLSFAQDAPLLSQKSREAVLPIFDPAAPLPARLLDRLGPIGEASRRPLETVAWRQSEPVCLRPPKKDIGQREQIGGPFEELVVERASGN